MLHMFSHALKEPTLMLHKSSHALKEPTLMLHMSSHAEMSLYKHSISTWCTQENLIFARILYLYKIHTMFSYSVCKTHELAQLYVDVFQNYMYFR